MRKRIGTIFAMAISLAVCASSASASSILVNGDFEGTTYTGPNGDIVPTGWTVGPPSNSADSKINVDTAVNAPTFLGPQNGPHYIRFQSPATSGRDCLYQDLTTIAGQIYNVSFWVGITSTSVGNNLGLDVEWDENTGNQSALGNAVYNSPSNTGPVNYQLFTFSATASTTLTRIDFHGIDTNGSILLDNISVSVPGAPEPVSMLLAGSGLLLVGVRRRRK